MAKKKPKIPILHYEIITKVKLIPGEKCYVLNYRKRPAIWEQGEVQITKVGIDKAGKPRNSYSVILDRRRTGRHEGKVIWLYVGDDSIERKDSIDTAHKYSK